MVTDLRSLATPHTTSYWVVTPLWATAMVGGAIGAYTTWSTGIAGVSVGAILAAVTTAWTAASFRSFKNTEFGTVFFFGKPVFKVAGGGLRLIPRGLFSVTKTAAAVYQIQLPGEPEDVNKGSDKDPLHTVSIEVEGKTVAKTQVRPIRITTKRPSQDQGDHNDPLNTQLTILPSFWYRFRVTDPFLFELALGDEAGAAQQLRDMGETTLTKRITTRTPVELTSEFSAIQEAFTEESKAAVADWGIEIVECGLIPFDYGKDLAVVLDAIGIEKGNISIAASKAAQTRITAAAEKDRLADEGRGRGIAEESEIAGRGRGIKRAGASVGVDPEKILAAQVAENTIGEGDVIIGTDGVQQVVALGKQIMKGTDNVDRS